MASRDWYSIASSEILLTAVGGGLLAWRAWHSPKFDLLIWYMMGIEIDRLVPILI
jgi:hypothetical protein